MSHAPDNQPAASQSNQIVLALQWLVMSAVAVALLSLGAAHLPPRLKLLGAFALGYGLVAGWVIGKLAQMSQLPRARTLIAAAAALILCGELGMSIESWRLQSAALRRLDQTSGKSGSAAFLPLLDTKHTPDDSASKKALDETRNLIQQELARRQQVLTEETRFAGYLRRRVSALGAWPVPWPALFWGAEVALGVVAGAWLFGRAGRRLLNSGPVGQ